MEGCLEGLTYWAHVRRDRAGRPAAGGGVPPAADMGLKRLRAWLTEQELGMVWPAEPIIGEDLRRVGLTQLRTHW